MTSWTQSSISVGDKLMDAENLLSECICLHAKEQDEITHNHQ